MSSGSSSSIERQFRLACEHIASFDDAKEMMRDAHLDHDEVMPLAKTRASTMWAVLSGQVDPRSMVGGEEISVPPRTAVAISSVWVDSLTVGTFMERRSDDPIQPVAGYDDVAAVARSLDDRTMILKESLADVVGYDPQQMVSLLAARIRPSLQKYLPNPTLGPLAALNGFAIGAEVVRRRRSGTLMGTI